MIDNGSVFSNFCNSMQLVAVVKRCETPNEKLTTYRQSARRHKSITDQKAEPRTNRLCACVGKMEKQRSQRRKRPNSEHRPESLDNVANRLIKYPP